MSTPRNNLPFQLSSFIGRERESAEVKRLLTTTRLLTLTGAGGCGKTALALHVTRDSLEMYADGACWVELAPLADPALVPQAIVKALGIVEQPGRALTNTLLDFLSEKALLLVLDNCEHLIEACAQLATRLLQGCPDLRILATSREALNIAGEVAWIVPSLQLPLSSVQLPVSKLEQYDAIRLFVERASAVQSGYRLTSENASAVANICQKLDGIPLAIELAAARMKVLSIEQIAARLDDALRLLTEGKRSAPLRHQTLRATMDWSYDLLSNPERALFRRLSVFAGGFTLEAAETICASDELMRDEVLDVLMHLLEKSLAVKQEQDGEARYYLLEPVRQYAADKLARAGESKTVRDRHLQFFTEWAESAEIELQRSDDQRCVQRIQTDHDNLSVGIEWSLAHPNLEWGLRLAVALSGFWFRRGYWSAGLAYLEALLGRSEGQAGAPQIALLRAKAFFATGLLAGALQGREEARAQFTQSIVIARSLGAAGKPILGMSLHHLARWPAVEDPVASRAWAEEALAIGRELDDPEITSNALTALGLASSMQDDYATARRLLEEARGVARTLCSRRLYGIIGINLGDISLKHGDYAAARACLAESLAIARTAGPQRGVAGILWLLAELEGREGNIAAAQEYSIDSLTLYRALGNRRQIASALALTGDIARQRRDFAQAYPLLMESLQLWVKLQGEPEAAYALESCACVAAQAQPEQAAILFGIAEACREKQVALATPYFAPGRPAGHEQAAAAVRTQLGAGSYARLLAHGRNLTLEQAIAIAEQVTITREALPLTSVGPRDPNALTARELEVVRLLAQGMSDAQIAENLVISRRTVSTHLTAIYGKLGVSSRAAATRYALDHKLV